MRVDSIWVSSTPNSSIEVIFTHRASRRPICADLQLTAANGSCKNLDFGRLSLVGAGKPFCDRE